MMMRNFIVLFFQFSVRLNKQACNYVFSFNPDFQQQLFPRFLAVVYVFFVGIVQTLASQCLGFPIFHQFWSELFWLFEVLSVFSNYTNFKMPALKKVIHS